jgi:hypothetical protein
MTTSSRPSIKSWEARPKENLSESCSSEKWISVLRCSLCFPSRFTHPRSSPSRPFILLAYPWPRLELEPPPLSIVPPDATSNSATRALSLNHYQTETYDLSGEPTTGALSTADTQRLQNQKGYLPVSWMEARTQIRCTLAILGALYGPDHPIPVGWRRMLRQYDRVEARLKHEMDTEVGPLLAPSLFVFHLQLIL